MLRITINSSLDNIYNFIDNRLVLIMSENRLRASESFIKLQVSSNKIKQNVQNTILYLEKEPKRATLLVVPTEKKSDKILQYPYGVALREKNSGEVDLYIDTMTEAIKKGILDRQQLGNRGKILMALLAVALGICALALFPLFILAVVFTIITYPILHFKRKKDFNKNQEIMRTIISIFEKEYSTKDKKDTKDWMDFWMRVRSESVDLITSI